MSNPVSILLLCIDVCLLVVGESDCFFEGSAVPDLDCFIVGASGEGLVVGVDGERFDGVGVCAFEERGWGDLVFDEVLIEGNLGS